MAAPDAGTGPDGRIVELRGLSVPAAGAMAVFTDRDGRLGIADVAASDRRAAFTPVPGSLSAGYTSSTVWVRLTVRAIDRADWWLYVSPPFIDDITVFTPDGAGGWQERSGGDTHDIAATTIPFRAPIFPVTLAVGQDSPVYVRLRSTSTVSANPVFYQPEYFPHASTIHTLFSGGFLALHVVIAINILYYTGLRDRLYAAYCAWVVLNGIAFSLNLGYGRQFLLPGPGMFPTHLLELVTILALPVASVFISRLLYLRHDHPWLARLYDAATWIGLGCFVLTLFGFFPLVAVPVNVIGLLLAVVAVVVSVRLAWQGFRPAQIYALAFAAHPMGLVLVTMRNVGLLPSGMLVDNSYYITSLVNVVLLNVGLLDRLNMGARAALEDARRRGKELEDRIAVQSKELAETSAALSEATVGRRRTEEALRESEALFQRLVVAAPVPLFVSVPTRRKIVFANERTAHLLGAPLDRLLSTVTLENLLMPDDLRRLVTALEAQDIVLDLELRLRSGGEEPLWVILSAARVRFHGEAALLIGLNDITSRRQLEKALTDARNQAETALEVERVRMREQRQLIATAAHEFKTPLTAIDRAAQMLQFDLAPCDGGLAGAEPDSRRVAQRMTVVRDNVRRLFQVVNSFLADAALEAGRPPVELCPIPLAPLLERCAARLDARLTPRTVEVRLPPAGLDVWADSRLLAIVLDNILDNACKYSQAGTPIVLEALATGPDVLIRVQDHGIGIPAAEAAMVGSRFFRASNAIGVTGTGLGLSTAERLMEAQNGSITVESRENVGTTVTVRLRAAGAEG